MILIRVQALLGFRKTVKGLDGHEIILSRTGVTQPGSSFAPFSLVRQLIPSRAGFVQVVEGEGMPIYHESGHGDLFVEYNVVLPPVLTPELRKGTFSSARSRNQLLTTPYRSRSSLQLYQRRRRCLARRTIAPQDTILNRNTHFRRRPLRSSPCSSRALRSSLSPLACSTNPAFYPLKPSTNLL